MLDVIVHCARKTEVAKWSYLFSTVGDPRGLFERCIELGQLDTAASYLIILQSLESPAASRDYALRLLDIALENDRWDLAHDLIRFLQATTVFQASVDARAHSRSPISPLKMPENVPHVSGEMQVKEGKKKTCGQ